jgi:hypothetical protein
MAELPPNIPTGAVPPPKKETGKVQPKKETVRINLPPKPSAAPTIKLPTLPPGGPTGASSAPAGVSPSAAAPMSLAAAPRPTAAAPAAHGAPATQTKPGATTAPRPVVVAAPAAPTIKGLDKGLIYAVAACAIIAVGLVFWGWYVINDSVNTFNS